MYWYSVASHEVEWAEVLVFYKWTQHNLNTVHINRIWNLTAARSQAANYNVSILYLRYKWNSMVIFFLRGVHSKASLTSPLILISVMRPSHPHPGQTSVGSSSHGRRCSSAAFVSPAVPWADTVPLRPNNPNLKQHNTHTHGYTRCVCVVKKKTYASL